MWDSYLCPAFISDYQITDPPLSAVSLTALMASPRIPGTAITLLAQATGGTQIEYRFQVLVGQEWQTVQDYSTTCIYNWCPQTIGSYSLKVSAREVGTTPVVEDTLEYETSISLPRSISPPYRPHRNRPTLPSH